MDGCRTYTDNSCCLSLTGDGPLHPCRKIHLFCLHQGNLDPPRLCLFVQEVLEFDVNLVSFSYGVIAITPVF